MSEEKESTEIVSQEHIRKQGEIVTDLTLRVAAMERLLISKKIIAESELAETLVALSEELMGMIKEKIESEKKAETP